MTTEPTVTLEGDLTVEPGDRAPVQPAPPYTRNVVSVATLDEHAAAPDEPILDRMKRELDEQLATVDERLRTAIARRDHAQVTVTNLRAERETIVGARARLNGRRRKAT